MHPTSPSQRQQLQRVSTHRESLGHDELLALLTQGSLSERIRAYTPSTSRVRRYPLAQTLSMFMTQALSEKRSCQDAVGQAQIQHVLRQSSPPASAATGGFCQARRRLPLALITELCLHTADQAIQQAPVKWHWRERRVRLVDGTTLSLPDTPANQARYPQQRGQQEGLGFPTCRLLAVTCLATGAVRQAAIGPYHGKGADETSLLRELSDTFEAGDLIVGDALFATYFFIASMCAKGVDVVMHQHGARARKTDFSQSTELGAEDYLVLWQKPKKRPAWMSEQDYDQAPEQLPIREFRVAGKAMVTTLLHPQSVSKTQLAALYKRRWNVELDLRNIKSVMGMGELSCKSPEMIHREIWVHLLAYNVIRLLIMKSGLSGDLLPRTLSFGYAVTLWLAAQHQLPGEKLQTLLSLISQCRVGQRPDRIEPRARKRRNRAYPLLTKPRHEAQKTLKIQGHPKRQKA